MKLFSIGNHLTPYLLSAIALLATGLAIESGNLIETNGHASPETQPAIEPIEQAAFSAPGINAFSEITERPLFIAGREPPKEEIRQSAPVKISPLRLQLEGVVITPAAKIAVVRNTLNNKILHLTPGMQHQNWELESITETIATFRQGEKHQELALKKPKPNTFQ